MLRKGYCDHLKKNFKTAIWLCSTIDLPWNSQASELMSRGLKNEYYLNYLVDFQCRRLSHCRQLLIFTISRGTYFQACGNLVPLSVTISLKDVFDACLGWSTCNWPGDTWLCLLLRCCWVTKLSGSRVQLEFNYRPKILRYIIYIFCTFYIIVMREIFNTLNINWLLSNLLSTMACWVNRA